MRSSGKVTAFGDELEIEKREKQGDDRRPERRDSLARSMISIDTRRTAPNVALWRATPGVLDCKQTWAKRNHFQTSTVEKCERNKTKSPRFGSSYLLGLILEFCSLVLKPDRQNEWQQQFQRAAAAAAAIAIEKEAVNKQKNKAARTKSGWLVRFAETCSVASGARCDAMRCEQPPISAAPSAKSR